MIISANPVEQGVLAMKCPHCGKRIKIELKAGKEAGAKRKKRKPREGTLAVHIEKYLFEYGRPAKVAKITDALQEKGVNTKAKNFRAVVNRTLVIDKRFRSVRRGYYQLAKRRRAK